MALRALIKITTVTAAEASASQALVDESVNGKSALISVSMNNKTNDGFGAVSVKAAGQSQFIAASKMFYLPKNSGATITLNFPKAGLPAKVRATYFIPAAADKLATEYLFNDEEDD